MGSTIAPILHNLHIISDGSLLLFFLSVLSYIGVNLPVSISRDIIPNFSCAKNDLRDLDNVFLHIAQ